MAEKLVLDCIAVTQTRASLSPRKLTSSRRIRRRELRRLRLRQPRRRTCGLFATGRSRRSRPTART